MKVRVLRGRFAGKIGELLSVEGHLAKVKLEGKERTINVRHLSPV